MWSNTPSATKNSWSAPSSFRPRRSRALRGSPPMISASSRPSVIRIGVAVERHSGGGQTVRALTCLPALVGAWRDVGGGILQLPIWAFPVKWETLMRPDWIKPGTRVLNQWRLGPALLDEDKLDP